MKIGVWDEVCETLSVHRSGNRSLDLRVTVDLKEPVEARYYIMDTGKRLVPDLTNYGDAVKAYVAEIKKITPVDEG